MVFVKQFRWLILHHLANQTSIRHSLVLVIFKAAGILVQNVKLNPCSVNIIKANLFSNVKLRMNCLVSL